MKMREIIKQAYRELGWRRATLELVGGPLAIIVFFYATALLLWGIDRG